MAESLSQGNRSERLFLLLSRWTFVTSLVILVSIGFYSAVGSTASDKALGQEYAALMSAVRSPVLYRLAWASESLYWLLIGGTLILLALLFARRWPILSAFVAACGMGQLTNSLAALSLSGYSDLAARFATVAPNEQVALLQSYLNLQRVEISYYGLGGLLQGAGFLLCAWAASRWTGFPRWVSVLLAIVGLLGAAWFILVVTGQASGLGRPMVLLDVISLFSVHAAMAVAFWHPSARLVADAMSTPAAA